MEGGSNASCRIFRRCRRFPTHTSSYPRAVASGASAQSVTRESGRVSTDCRRGKSQDLVGWRRATGGVQDRESGRGEGDTGKQSLGDMIEDTVMRAVERGVEQVLARQSTGMSELGKELGEEVQAGLGKVAKTLMGAIKQEHQSIGALLKTLMEGVTTRLDVVIRRIGTRDKRQQEGCGESRRIYKEAVAVEGAVDGLVATATCAGCPKIFGRY